MVIPAVMLIVWFAVRSASERFAISSIAFGKFGFSNQFVPSFHANVPPAVCVHVYVAPCAHCATPTVNAVERTSHDERRLIKCGVRRDPLRFLRGDVYI